MSKLKNLFLWIAAITFDLSVLYSAMTHEPIEGEPSQAWFLFAASLGLGLYSAYNEQQAQENEADRIEQQAEINRQQAAAQAERDSLAEAERVSAERDEKRRRRDSMEAAFAKSGVLLDGSVNEVLVDQRETDELNVQRIHDKGNDKRKLDMARADQQYKQSIYEADSIRGASDVGLAGNLLSTGLNAVSTYDKYGINGKGMGSISGGKPTTANKQKGTNAFSWFKL